MATTFKRLLPEDILQARNVLHESIPITGSIVSGTYSETNIKDYAHGMFQSVYDYPYLSSSANHIFDITLGISKIYGNVSTYGTLGVAAEQGAQKNNIYAQMAQVLVGHDTSGSIRPFDGDGDPTTADKLKEVYFINFARLLVKDEIKKGTFSLELGVTQDDTTPNTASIFIKDTGAASSYKVNSPAGEYGILKLTTGTSSPGLGTITEGGNVGLIYYQAGIAVINANVFGSAGLAAPSHMDTTSADILTVGIEPRFENATIAVNAFNLRNRIINVSFNNTTELNSTVYFCRANANEFNYSSNPTYLNGSEIRTRPAGIDTEPSAYITSVGLYGANNELLAVAKLSEPLKKTPSNELTIRTRLDF